MFYHLGLVLLGQGHVQIHLSILFQWPMALMRCRERNTCVSSASGVMSPGPRLAAIMIYLRCKMQSVRGERKPNRKEGTALSLQCFLFPSTSDPKWWPLCLRAGTPDNPTTAPFGAHRQHDGSGTGNTAGNRTSAGGPWWRVTFLLILGKEDEQKETASAQPPHRNRRATHMPLEIFY